MGRPGGRIVDPAEAAAGGAVDDWEEEEPSEIGGVGGAIVPGDEEATESEDFDDDDVTAGSLDPAAEAILEWDAVVAGFLTYSISSAHASVYSIS